MDRDAIHEFAVNKAFARVTMLGIEVDNNKVDLESGFYGGDITLEQFMSIVEGTKKELKIWEYITESLNYIENDRNYR
jgi:hypothetical protein